MKQCEIGCGWVVSEDGLCLRHVDEWWGSKESDEGVQAIIAANNVLRQKHAEFIARKRKENGK